MPAAPRIAVVGSINMDLVVRCGRLPRPGETIIADDAREIPGGKGANQAVAAARLGAKVSMIGRVGSDSFADRLLDNLRHERVDTAHTLRTEDCASGLAIISVEATGENSITVVPGANGHMTPNDIDAASDKIERAEVLLLQLEIPMEVVLAAIRVARDANTRVILDPAPVPDHVPNGLLDVDFICPNESEAAALLGQSADSIEDVIAAKSLAKRGPGTAIITLGSRGAVVCETSGLCQHIPSIDVQAVDTTAAGDAFAGAFGVSLAEKSSILDAVRFGCIAGAIAASRIGAQPSIPIRSEILQVARDSQRTI